MSKDGLIRLIDRELEVDIAEDEPLVGKRLGHRSRIEAAQIGNGRRLRYDDVDADAEGGRCAWRRRLVDDSAVSVGCGSPLDLAQTHQLLGEFGAGFAEGEPDQLRYFQTFRKNQIDGAARTGFHAGAWLLLDHGALRISRNLRCDRADFEQLRRDQAPGLVDRATADVRYDRCRRQHDVDDDALG